MAGAFPTLSFGTTVKYPLKLTISCVTQISKSPTGDEQRYVDRAPMVTVDATYNNLPDADRLLIDNFFDSQKGAFDSTWTLAFDARTLTAMRFMADEIKWQQSLEHRWNTTFQAFGVYPTISSPPSEFPMLSTGAVTQLPWSKSRTYDTSFTDMPSGVRHALALRGGGLTDYPSDPIRGWQIGDSAITPAEADDVIKFFISKSGRFGSFTFTDPDTTVAYSSCRFDSDELEVQYIGPNQCSLTVNVVKN